MSNPAPGPLEALLRRDRLLVLLALLAVILLAWLYLIRLYLQMGDAGSAGGMMAPQAWTGFHFLWMFAMWSVMMAAMMLPSAAPMILLYARVERQRQADQNQVPAAAFSLGYLTIWTAFSLLATLLQYLLEQQQLLSPMMVSNSAALSGALLIAAGAWQLSPLKQACLRQCRSPLVFIQHHWRNGTAGAFTMGVQHGLYCLGCCWSLMLLLFVAGVMNLLWIALLSIFVLTEKLFYRQRWHSQATALVLIAAGLLTIVMSPG